MNIGIIGAGKVGIALGHALKAKGFTVAAIASRRQASLDEARRYVGQGCVYALDNLSVFDACDVVAVTPRTGRSGRWRKASARPASGSTGRSSFTRAVPTPLPSSPLSIRGGLPPGSFHPLQTFPDIDSGIAVLPETYIFIEGDDNALPSLRTLA